MNNKKRQNKKINHENEEKVKILTKPPVLLLICLCTGFAVHFILLFFSIKINFIDNKFHLLFLSSRIIAGLIAFGFAGFLAFSAFKIMIKNNCNIDPERSATLVIKEGPFKFTRNPLYLSLILSMLGITILLFSSAMMLMTVIFFLLLRNGVVKKEEAELEKKFNGEYLDYKKRVRRWI